MKFTWEAHAPPSQHRALTALGGGAVVILCAVDMPKEHDQDGRSRERCQATVRRAGV